MLFRSLVIPPAPYTTADVAMTGRLAAGGKGKTVTVERPDALALSPCAILVFDGTAGQRLRLAIRELTMPAAEVSVFHPDGTAALPPTVVWKRETEVLIEVPPLAFTGSHTVMVSPVAALTGTLIVAIVRGQ